MLTWAIVYLVVHGAPVSGGFMFIAMVFDMIMVVAITACWWGKYYKDA